MEIVSGRTGKPHVTSQQFRQLIEGTVGQESCILTSGENLEPELASNNSLKIRSGMLAHHGNISSVKIGTYDEVGLSNGSQGMKRIDLVVCRYTKNAETEVESCDWVVIMGTPAASNPVAPAYTVGNLQDGDLVDDCPIFEVHYDGINVTEVKKLVSVVSNLTELNSKMKLKSTIACTQVVLGIGQPYIVLETLKSIQEKEGLLTPEYTNQVVVSCMNGDWGARALKVIAVIWQGTNCIAMFNDILSPSEQMRINYTITVSD